MTDGADDRDEAALAEAARRMFAQPFDFVIGARELGQLPDPAGRVEVAFAGRSNVGKSSLINALTGRRALARTSNTPGRTRELNFFCASGALMLVDLPGYGYAEAPRDAVQAWTRLTRDYLRGRQNLARVFLLIDARHGIKTADAGLLDALDTAAVSYQAVLTKADKVAAGGREAMLAAVAGPLSRRPAAHPDIIVTSARSGEGIEALRTAIARLVGIGD